MRWEMFKISTEIQYREAVLPFLQAKRKSFSSKKGGRNCFRTVECLFWLKQFRKIKWTAGETKRSFFPLEFCSLHKFSFYRLNALLPPQSTYIYRVQSSVWRLPNYLLNPRPLPCVSSPRTKGGGGGGVNTRWAVRGWGGISEDARHWIGLLQYNPSTVTAKEFVYVGLGEWQCGKLSCAPSCLQMYGTIPLLKAVDMGFPDTTIWKKLFFFCFHYHKVKNCLFLSFMFIIFP